MDKVRGGDDVGIDSFCDVAITKLIRRHGFSSPRIPTKWDSPALQALIDSSGKLEAPLLQTNTPETH
jgi:hypothetical protein